MDRTAALAAFDEQLRNAVRPSLGGGRFERAGRVIRCVAPSPDGWNGVDWSDLDESTADAAIAEQVAYFADLGRRFEWKYYAHDRPADLPDRLRAAGLESEQEEALMVAEVAAIPTDLPAPEGISLREANDDAGLELARRVHDAVFGGDHGPMITGMKQRLADDPGALSVVVAIAGDQPVSASRIDFHDGTDFASLWGGGTLPAVAAARHLPRDGRLPHAAGRRTRLHLPAHGRAADEPPDPGEARLHPPEHDDPVHVPLTRVMPSRWRRARSW